MLKNKTSCKMLSLLLAVAMVVTMINPMPARAAVVTKDENILLGLEPTSNAGNIINPMAATDGEKVDSSSNMNNTEIAAGAETGGADNGYSNWNHVYLQYDFGQPQAVKEISLYRNTYENAVSTFKDVKVELALDADFAESTVVYDTADYEETVDDKGLPQTLVLDAPVQAQYIRVWQKGHYIQNTNSSWKGYSNSVRFNEIEVVAEVTEEVPDPEPDPDPEPQPEEMVDTNILVGKTPTTNSPHKQVVGGPTVPQVEIKNPAAATDGDIGGSDSEDNNTKIIAGAEIGGSDNGYSGWDQVYLQYDFGKPRLVKEVDLYRNTYPAAVSTFKDVKVELSTNPEFENSLVIFDTADFEETVSTKGYAQAITLSEPVEAQYIRIWQRGHYIQNTNSPWKGYSNGINFNEIEVIASVPKSEIPAPPPEAEKVNIALNKVPYVRGLTPTNIEAITDGNVDDNYAVHNSTGQRWLQFEYKNSYSMKEIKFKLEEGTYKSVKVSVSSNPTSEGTVVFNESNFTQGPEMKVIDLGKKGQKGKYVRFTVEKDASSPVKYSEIEIWATGDNYDESKPEYVAPESKYDTLVWSDEFDGDTVDESKWTIVDGMVNHGAIYNRGAVSIQKDDKGSYLALNSKNYETTDALINAVGWDQYQDQNPASHVTWSSGRVESKDKFSFQFGRMAVKAKPNDSKGIWPAIWMLCQDETGHDEIDVLEYLGQDSWDAWTTNHYGILDYNKASHGISTRNYEAWCQDFHVFEVEWDPERISFFIDGRQVHSTTNGKGGSIDGMHTRPMFAILETQVGDGWVGPVDYSKQDTKQDSDFLIDWVRVYQTADQAVARFDNLENVYGNKSNDTTTEGYSIKPYEATEGLLEYSVGNEQYEDKDNFYYGGQPRYEESRVAPADQAGEQSITYQIPGVKDVHLTAYYQTLSDFHRWSGAAGSNKGKSIRNSVRDGKNIDFKVFTSANGKEWAEFNNMHVVDNFPEAYPSYARLTFDAYGVPEGTNYIKVVFPEFKGAQYSLNSGEAKNVLNTDIQLAKVTFLQEKDAVMPEIPEKELTSIKITKAPDKVEYTEGEKFDRAGMVVKAQWSDGTETDVTKEAKIKDADKTLVVGDKEVVVTYKDGAVTKEAKQAITVKAKTDMVDANILLGKKPSTNSTHKQVNGGPTVPQVAIKNPDAATDGEIGGSDDDSNNTKIIAGAETGVSDNGYSGWDHVYLEYNFEKPRLVKEIKLYRNTYPAAVSDFKDVKVELSSTPDFKDSVVVFDGGDYKETVSKKGEPQVLTLKNPTEAQYIRIWQKGHYIQNTNSSWKGYSNGVLFNEIEVIASVPKSEIPAPPPEAEKVNIALNKVPYVRGLTPTNIEAITDGKADDNYAVHNSKGQRWLQFEYKNSYNMKEIRFKLEEGTYKSVKVSVSSSPTSEGKTVFNESNFTQGPDMKVVDLGKKGQKGKYVRFTVEKDANSPVKYSEIEIWATGDNYDESKPEYVAPESKYDTLVWSDEFDGDTVDESKWTIVDGMVNHGAIYNRDAVSIKKDDKGSYLALNSKNYETTDALIDAVGWDQYQNQSPASHVTWSSGRVESKDKFSFQFGRMAVKAKPNDSKGIWPAIWMLCQDETGHDEIDVLEYLGQDSWDAWTTNHYGILDDNKGSHGISTKNYEAWCQDFHVFEVEWDPELITFYIDGKRVHSTNWGKGGSIDGMHTRPMFAILETQVGDGWVGPVDYSKQDTKQDSDFLIDWVRVYQTADQAVARFDNLENVYGDKEDYKVSEGYGIKPFKATEGLLEYSVGEEQYEDKDNFYYGGQPRYEESRVAPADKEGEQSITYQIPGVKDVHLTTYYQTLTDFHQWSNPAGSYKGKSIRNAVPFGTNIDFKVFTSANGKDWAEFENMHVVDNFPEANPSYARITFDAYGVPEGTNYIKVVFPDFKGARYSLSSGSAKDVVNTDIQLAKVTFLQKKGAVMPEPELTALEIATAPDKVEYTEGETFDATGMVVKAQWSDGTETDVTKEAQIKDAEKALAVGDKEVVVTYTNGDVTVEAKQAITVKAKPVVLESIQIAKAPAKVEYTEGETFDPAGMIVKAQWSNDTETDVTKEVKIKNAEKALAVGDKEVVITYTKGDVTVEVKQAITVNEKKDIGFKAIGKTWYYFDKDGNKVKGWKEVDGYWYYFDKEGAMVKNWQKIGKHTFYFDGSGHMLTGWRLIESKWYYFYNSGRMLYGWQQINNQWYYLNKTDGSMVTGWMKDGQNWFYFKGDGSMATGWQAVGTKWYYFYSSGRMLTGWQQIDGYWYYLKSSGEMTKGWAKIGVNTFYFNGSGHMLTGRQQINGKWYTFAESGALR